MLRLLFLFAFLLYAVPLHAQEQPPSLVDRLVSLLKNKNMPRLEVHPVAQPSPPPDVLPPRRAEVELAHNFLPVYDLERGGANEGVTPQVLPFFASAPLQEPMPGIRMIVIMIPDSDREAARAFAFARNAQDAASAAHPEWFANRAYVFVPQFLNPEDILPRAGQWPDGGSALLRWPGAGWIYGADSLPEIKPGNFLTTRGMSSFAVMDFALLAVARREIFPQLENVVIAGGGGGGDFVQRYAALGIAPDILAVDNISVRFVVADAYSYLYLDKTRAVAQESDGYALDSEPVFAPPKEGACVPYNAYPYGFENQPTYAQKQGEMDIRLRYITRNVFYLTGKNALRALPDASPQACAVQLQGKSLAERARIYFAALTRLFGEEDVSRSQKLVLVPEIAEEAPALWQSPCGLSAVYGSGTCTTNSVGEQLKTVR